MALLIFEKADGGRVEIPIENDPISIGRGPHADVSLDEDSEISRHHCALLLWEDDWVLKDAHSANGTWVNQKRIEACILKNEDIIHVGKSEMEFLAQERQRGKEPCATLQLLAAPKRDSASKDRKNDEK